MIKETVTAKESTVSCAGSQYPYDHPIVYLEIPEDKNQVECPYCSRIFELISHTNSPVSKKTKQPK